MKFPESARGMADSSRLWRDASLLRRTVLFGSAFLVLVILTYLLYVGIAREKDGQERVTHEYQVLDAIQGLTANLLDAETGHRGYLSTGDESYVEPLESALRDGRSALETLRQLTAGNPAPQAKLDTLNRLVEAKFSELQRTLRRKDGLEVALTAIRAGDLQRLTSESRAVLRAMESESRVLVAKRTQEAEDEATRARWVLGLGSGSLLMLLAIGGTVIERDSRNRERTRLAVSQSEEHFRLALDAANAGTWEWDLETNDHQWSEELWNLFDIEPYSRALSYDPWREFVHPDDLTNAEQAVAQAAKTGTELNVEFRVSDREGRERWLLSRGRPLRNSQGRAVRFLGIVLDITERKHAEEATRAREQDLRRFAEFAPVAIAMFDREMRYLAASQCFRNEFSLGDQELLGRSHYEVFPEIPEHWREIHRRCLAGAVERHPGEFFQRLDGSAQWTRWDIQPWHRADGQIGGIVLFTEDITRQKKSEEALRASEANYRTLFESASDGITVTDAQLHYVDANATACRMFGYTREELLARSIPDVLAAEEMPRLAPFMEGMTAGEVSKSEWRFRRKDGSLYLCEVCAIVLPDGRLLSIGRDITERKRVAEELGKSQERLALAIQATQLGTFDFSPKTGTLIWSELTRRHFGLPSCAEVSYRHFPARDSS